MGLVGASLLALLVIEYEIPFWLAAIAALVVGTLFGTLMELVVIRRLFYAPRVDRAGRDHRHLGPRARDRRRPIRRSPTSARRTRPAVDNTWNDVLGLRVTGAQLAVLVVVPLVAFALGWFLNRTLVGRTVKASAENPDLARVQGINPKIVSTAVWSIAGFVATLTMILVAADNGGAAKDLLTLGPEHAGARAGGRGHREHGVVPAGDVRRSRHRRRAGADQLQLPRQAGPDRRAALRGRADRGGAAEPQPGTGRDPDVLVRAEGAGDPRAAARRLVGAGGST